MLKNDIERTLEAHKPDPSEGFAEMIDDKVFHLMAERQEQKAARKKKRLRLVPVTAAALVVVMCVGMLAANGHFGLINRPDEIRPGEGKYTVQPIETVLAQGTVTVPGETDGTGNASVLEEEDQSDMVDRGSKFIPYWNGESGWNDADLQAMLDLCTSEWKEKAGDANKAREALKEILGNTSYHGMLGNIWVSGESGDPVRTLIMRGYGKWAQTQISYDMKLEADGLWYIDPESIQITSPDESKRSLAEMKLEDLGAELEYQWPGIAEKLIPMNLSCESQGFRVEMISGLVKERESWIVYSVQDLETDRGYDRDIDQYWPYIEMDIGHQTEQLNGMIIGFDKDERREFIIAHQQYAEPINPENRNITFKIKDISIFGRKDTDLTPLIEQYGKTVDGIESPELIPDETIEKKRNVLDFHNPLDIPIDEGVLLTGIGWIDDELHVQVHYTKTENDDSTMYFHMCNSYPWGAEGYDPDFTGEMWIEDSGQGDNRQTEVWYEYFSPLKRKDVEYVKPVLEITTRLEKVEVEQEIRIPLNRIMASGSQDAAESIGTDAPEETKAASGVESADINALLEQEWPGITGELVPVNLSCEKQGIRIDVLSAVAKDKEAWIVYTLQDLEGDRTPGQDIYQYVPSVYTDFDHGAHYVASRYLLYDETTRKSFMAAYIQYYDTIQPDSRYVSIMINHINIIGETKTDLAPLIEQYGKTAEGTEPPELLYTSPVDLKKKVLDFHNPLDIPVDEDVTLTGIGWIDNELHVQLHMTDRVIRAFAAKSDAGNSYVDGIQYCETGFEEESWDEDGNGRGDWAEFISEVKPEEKDSVKAEIRIQKYIESVTDDWEIQIPLNQIMTGGSQDAEEPDGTDNQEETETASGAKSVDIDTLIEYEWPGLSKELIPVNLSCEKQGFLVEVISALIKGKNSWIVYSVQDLTEDRLSGQNIETYFPSAETDLIQDAHEYGNMLMGYTGNPRKTIMAQYAEYNESIQPENRLVSFKVKDITMLGQIRTDLTSLIKEYGKTAEGIESPKLLCSDSIDLKRKVLDFHNPLNIPIDEDVVLTGIGWIDNELHIQLQYKNNITKGTFPAIHCSISNCFPEGETDKYDIFTSESWDTNNDGVADWEEFILHVQPEEMERAGTQLTIQKVLDLAEDNWEFQIPLNSIRKEGNRFEHDGLVLSLEVDDTVTVIKDPSYKELEKITIPERQDGSPYIRKIGEGAFEDCVNLKAAKITKYVDEIKDHAFKGCENLVSLDLWRNCEPVGEDLYAECTGVVSIGEGAFEGCSALAAVALPDNVMTIGGSAFRGCRSMGSIMIPNGVKFEGGYVFADCTSLAYVTLPECMENLEDYMFSGCESLDMVIIREGTRTIGRGAFQNCGKLSLVEIPYSVYYISDYAFENCGSLKKIEIPEIVSYIGKNAFTGCENVVCVVYEGSYAQQYCEENGIQYEIRQAE